MTKLAKLIKSTKSSESTKTSKNDEIIEIFRITCVNVLARNPNLFPDRHFGHILFLPGFLQHFWQERWCYLITKVKSFGPKIAKKSLIILE